MIYNKKVIDPYTIKAILEHKKRYNIVIGEEKYIFYVLQQIRVGTFHYVYEIVLLFFTSSVLVANPR